LQHWLDFNIFLRFPKSRRKVKPNPFISVSGVNVQRVWDVFRESKESFTDSFNSKDQKEQSDEKLNANGSWEGGDDKQEKIHAKELQKTVKLALFLVTFCVIYITYSSFGASAVTEGKKISKLS
jgi:hypothetical protein